MAQNIRELTPEKYRHIFLKKAKKVAERDNLYFRFMIGEDCIYELRDLHTLTTSSILNRANCTLNNYINDVIRGEIKDKCDISKPVSHNLQKYYNKQYEEKEVIKDVCKPIIEW